jgi:hypothetical protein
MYRVVKGKQVFLASIGHPTSAECSNSNSIQNAVSGGVPATSAWETDCATDGSETKCEIGIDTPRDIIVFASRRHQQIPDIEIGMGANNAKNSALQIGETTFDSGGVGHAIIAQAPLAIAKMCTEKGVTNLTDGKTYSTDGFCDAAASMFAMLYACQK